MYYHRLLGSFVFDIGAVKSSMYSPSVNIYFDFENPDKPIKLMIKYKWATHDLWYPFNDFIKDLLTNGGLVIWLRGEITEHVHDYEGDLLFDFDEGYYMSSVGKEIGFVKDFEAAVKLYRKEG